MLISDLPELPPVVPDTSLEDLNLNVPALGGGSNSGLSKKLVKDSTSHILCLERPHGNSTQWWMAWCLTHVARGDAQRGFHCIECKNHSDGVDAKVLEVHHRFQVFVSSVCRNVSALNVFGHDSTCLSCV